MLKTAVSIIVGALLGTIGARYIFVGSWLSLIPWGIVGLAIGLSLIGFVSAYTLFLLASVVITIGEMIMMPTSQALAANFAPVDLRGRYMAVFGLSWAIPAMIGPGAGGWILDNFNPNLLWYGGGILCIISALSFCVLHFRLGKQLRFAAKVNEELPADATA